MTIFERLRFLAFVGAIFVVYASELLLLSGIAFAKFSAESIPNVFWSKPALIIHGLAVMGVLCFFYGFFIEPYWLDVNFVTVETEKFTRAKLRMVQISDLHCDKKQRNEEKLIKIINCLEPDVIVFTGDSLNASETLPRFKRTLSKLEAKMGKFAVHGNFDVHYWSRLDLFGQTGFKVLDADTITLEKNGEGFCISGLSCEYPNKWREVLENIRDDNLSIFLYHYPDLIDQVHEYNVDLYLCGHTHGGQIALPFYGAVITLSTCGKKYESGEYHVGKMLAYVNRGIGMESGLAPRVRFWARPEIAVFDIVPKKD